VSATRSFKPDAPAAGLGPGSGPAATFASTEHFTLQTARALTVSEGNGRASIYLAALSSSLIALAFIGQISRLGVAFYAFALILLPVLAFVGTVTFQLLFQSSIADIAYAHRIALVRSHYLRVSPELELYLVCPPWNTGAAVPGSTGCLATGADGRRDGRGGQQRRGGGVRRRSTGRGGGSTRSPSRSPRERSSEPGPSRCTTATTIARATPTAQRPSIGPRSSFRLRNRPTRPERRITMSPISRGFRGHRPEADSARVPPGQHVVDDPLHGFLDQYPVLFADHITDFLRD
jgi:hypothetical protein